MRIPFPFQGVSEAAAYVDQPPLTCRDGANMRSVSPVTGRMEGEQRSGLALASSVITTADTANAPVNWIGSITYQDRKITYTQLTAPLEKWQRRPRDLRAMVAAKVDTASNTYFLTEGNLVVKVNTEGTLVYNLAVPVPDKAMVCRALEVDISGNWFVAVSANGNQKKAKVWKYTHNEDKQPIIAWEIELEKYVERIKFDIVSGELRLSENDVIEQKGYLSAWTGVDTDGPTMLWRTLLAYPIRGIDIGPDGCTYFTCPPNAARGQNPYVDTVTQLSTQSRSWEPTDLAGYQNRIQSQFDARDLDSLVRAGDGNIPEDGDPVVIWKDLSAFGRHLYSGEWGYTAVQNPEVNAPKFVKKSLGDHPALSFTNAVGVAAGDAQYMSSGTAPSVKAEQNDISKQVIPGYRHSSTRGSGYLVLMVIKPNVSTAGTGGTTVVAGQILNVDNTRELGNNGGIPRIQANYSLVGGAATQGILSTKTYGAAGDPPEKEVSVENASDACIVMWCNDGRSAASVTGSGTHARSFLRVNGSPVGAAYHVPANASADVNNYRNENKSPTFLGGYGTTFSSGIPTAQLKFGNFSVLKILTLHDSLSVPGLATPGEHEVIEGDPASTTADNEITKLEGWAAHDAGLQHLLPANHPYKNYPPTKTGIPSQSVQYLLTSLNGMCGRVNPGGAVSWISPNAHSSVAGLGTRGAGFGYDIKADVANSPTNSVRLICVGPRYSATNDVDGAIMRMVFDESTTFTNSTWYIAEAGASNWIYAYPQIDVDKFGNIFLPWSLNAATINATVRVVKLDAGAFVTVADWSTTPAVIGTRAIAQVVAIDPNYPVYEPDAVTIAKAFGAGLADDGNASDYTARRVDCISVAFAAGVPRARLNLYATNGFVYSWDDSSSTLLNPTDQLLPNTLICAVAAFGKIFFTDGLHYRYYDPVKAIWAVWSSLTAGAAPEWMKLLDLWRGRMVRARDPDSGSNWHMTALGDPFDSDTEPPVVNTTQSVDGESSEIGHCPDVINGIVPYTEDLLFFLCENSVWRLTGDPMMGGQLDLITKKTGGAFGIAHAQDDKGNVYFVGDKGGVWAMSGFNAPIRISRADGQRLSDIERRLAAAMQNNLRVQLVWNNTDELLHVFFIPYDATNASPVTHYTWERRSGAWWPDTYTDKIITAVGESAEGGVIIAAGDRLYTFSRSARDDAGTAIQSYVVIGPFLTNGEGVHLRGVSVLLASRLQGATLSVYRAEEVDVLGDPVFSANITAGRSVQLTPNTQGMSIFIRIGNNLAGESWGFQSLDLWADGTGMVRSER